MSANEFVHLHLHTQYSLLDGSIRLKDLFPRLAELGMGAVAMTDHGNAYGLIDFCLSAQKAGKEMSEKLQRPVAFKPILGSEIYVAAHSRFDRTGRGRDDGEGGKGNHHLVLLAIDEEGYRNLCRLLSRANLEGFYGVPRADHELLAEHHRGLVALSACMSGEIPYQILQGDTAAARATAGFYRDLFGPDRFYLEIQDNRIAGQERVNRELLALSAELGIPLVATNDCHYLHADDYRVHDALLCIRTKAKLREQKRFRYDTDQLYLKSPAEMAASFGHIPGAIANTIKIAEMAGLKLNLKDPACIFPIFEVPDGFGGQIDYLRHLAREGLRRRIEAGLTDPACRDEYGPRLEHELGIIEKTGFPGYFLVVWDFIRHARSSGIPVGPGRGSGTGSLVAYALGITNLDPIRYQLFFERFLNDQRVSPPDFDIDFCQDNRERVIQYVVERYGADRTAQIVTFGETKPKSIVRDVARVMEIPLAEADVLAKLVPAGAKSLPEAREAEPKLAELIDGRPDYQELFHVASRLENLNRHAGIHAAGLIIADRPLQELVPLARVTDKVVVQYDKEFAEKVGLIKFDFLGLITLTVIANTLRLIRESGRGFPHDIDNLPLDDPEVYRFLASGRTLGVFQIESEGMRSLMQNLKPTRFEEIIAAIALYRPGPMALIGSFVARRHGRERVDYLLPELEEILRETYGVIVYQEQVMQIARRIAGFSLAQADILRKVMGKKDSPGMAAQRASFIDGALARGFPADKVEELFNRCAEFSRYGFNKSHSAGYAALTYQTAFLKVHHPTEFMAALLTSEVSKSDKVQEYVREAKTMGIPMLGPDINRSQAEFRPEGKAIRFGLSAIKGLGEGAIEELVSNRGPDRPYAGLFDLVERNDGQKLNKKAVECLIKAGALDGLDPHRSRLLASLDLAYERAQQVREERRIGQQNLFDMLGAAGGGTGRAAVEPSPVAAPDFSHRQKLLLEKEALGFFLSGSPLDGFEKVIRRLSNTTTRTFAGRDRNADIAIAGIVVEHTDKPGKTGDGRVIRGKLQDLHGEAPFIFCPKADDPTIDLVRRDHECLVFHGRTSVWEKGETTVTEIRVNRIVTVHDALWGVARTVFVKVPALMNRDGLARLRDFTRRHEAAEGGLKMSLCFESASLPDQTVCLDTGARVALSEELLDGIEEIVGTGNVMLN